MTRKDLFVFIFVTAIFSVLRLSMVWTLLPWLFYDIWPRLKNVILGKFTVQERNNWNNDDSIKTFEWFNRILALIWLRSLRQFVFRQFKRNVGKNLANSSLKLVAFDIGKSPPKFKNIVINRANKG